MKIDTSYKPNLAPVTSRNSAQNASAPAASNEEVVLSTAASVLHADEKPPVNSARIQEIKDAIAQGRFKINPEAIADSLIDSARNLINSQRKA